MTAMPETNNPFYFTQTIPSTQSIAESLIEYAQKQLEEKSISWELYSKYTIEIFGKLCDDQFEVDDSNTIGENN